MNVDIAQRLAETLEPGVVMPLTPDSVPIQRWMLHAAVAEIEFLRAVMRGAAEMPALLPELLDLIEPPSAGSPRITS